MARIIGSAKDDTLTGSRAGDFVDGRGGDDNLLGRAGGDEILGGPGLDALFGQAGDDLLRGGGGGDGLEGGKGDDRLRGGGGDDEIHGDVNPLADSYDTSVADGRDRIAGGGGDDLLSGGYGDDVVHGDAGGDTFTYANVFNRVDAYNGRDVFADFVRGEDLLDLTFVLDGIEGRFGAFDSDDNGRLDGDDEFVQVVDVALAGMTKESTIIDVGEYADTLTGDDLSSGTDLAIVFGVTGLTADDFIVA